MRWTGRRSEFPAASDCVGWPRPSSPLRWRGLRGAVLLPGPVNPSRPAGGWRDGAFAPLRRVLLIGRAWIAVDPSGAAREVARRRSCGARSPPQAGARGRYWRMKRPRRVAVSGGVARASWCTERRRRPPPPFPGAFKVAPLQAQPGSGGPLLQVSAHETSATRARIRSRWVLAGPVPASAAVPTPASGPGRRCRGGTGWCRRHRPRT